MSVGPLAAEDLDEAVALWERCGLTRPWNDARQEYARAVVGPASTVLGRRDGDGLVATALVGEDGRRGWLYYLAVAPERRGEGWGSEMVRAGEAWLAQRGIAKAMLMVRADNSAVISFYEHLGYEVESTTLLSRWLVGE